MFSRRHCLSAIGGLAAAIVTKEIRSNQACSQENSVEPKRRSGRIRQSVMGWCFNPMHPVELARQGKQLGLSGIEGVDSKHYPAIRDLGLDISLVGSHGFAKGPVDRDYHAMVQASLRASIDTAVQFGSHKVITFTGMRVAGMNDLTAMQNCLECWQQVIEYAEKNQIVLCLEHLNSRDSTHPMKGHPGYFGDDVDLCLDLVRKMDSPCFRLLFDIYHVQVMHGDVIRRIRNDHAWIGHYHTAGCPGRGELDDQQEINYPAVMRTILETGYQGFVAQEFIPTWKNPLDALDHAIGVCDV